MLVSAVNLGCKVNEYETQSILNQLKNAGYELVDWPAFADLYIVNTCAVTNTGEQKSRQFLSKITKINKDAKIVVVGCAVQNNPEQFLKNKNVVAITGNQGKEQIEKIIKEQQRTLLEIDNQNYSSMSLPLETKDRQFIKIQDGCNNFCSYCIIPYIRGRSRSRNLDEILDEIKQTKCKEIVLTGIDMSDYRINGEKALDKLVYEVDKLGVRFRISSLECSVITKEFVELLCNCKNFCPHFHLSLQSACNQTLKRMNRHYTIEEFIEKVDLIRTHFKQASISTDIIAGFKGETEQEFLDTLNNLKRIEFSFMHVFPYSERKGTNAEKLSGAVPKNVATQRVKILLELNAQFKKNFFSKNLGSIHDVLVEEKIDNQNFVGYTDNYIKTKIKAESLPVGEIVTVKLVAVDGEEGMIAELI